MQYVYSHQYLCISIDSVMLTLKYPSVQSPQSIYIYICPTLLLCFTYLLLIFNACESEIRSTYNMQHTHRTQHKSQSKCFAKLSHTFSRNARADRMLCGFRLSIWYVSRFTNDRAQIHPKKGDTQSQHRVLCSKCCKIRTKHRANRNYDLKKVCGIRT